MFLPCFMHVLCKTRCSQVDRVRMLVFFVQKIHRRMEYRLSFPQILSSRYQSRIDDGMLIDRTSDVIKCTRRNRSEKVHCPAVQDQWNCVLNDLEELGSEEFLVLMDQYSMEIFSCFLTLLPFDSSIHQTNAESTENRSEDDLLISRIQSLHHLLEVNDHDEEEHSAVLTLGKRCSNKFLAQCQSKIFHRQVQILKMSRPEYVFVVSF